jgi:hypothetical protein
VGGVSWTTCLGWPRTMILPISASQVARITDMIHQRPAIVLFNLCIYNTCVNEPFWVLSPQWTVFFMLVHPEPGVHTLGPALGDPQSADTPSMSDAQDGSGLLQEQFRSPTPWCLVFLCWKDASK